MTLHVDDALLKKVMATTGAATKTAAIDLALREMARRSELTRLASQGLGLSSDELKEAFDPASDLEQLRKLETPVTYGRKPRAR